MIDAPGMLRRMFDAAVASCHPSHVVAPALPARPRGRVLVLGAGKAAAAMAQAVEVHWGGPLSGEVVTRYGHDEPTQFIKVLQAGHPFPDSHSAEAAQHALSAVRGLNADDLVLVLLSGGGSALWSAPLSPITLAEKQALTRALVLSGARISEINTVRKHVSAIKGGRLAAAAHPARVLTLAISDVPHDDVAIIASGPTVGDATTQATARDILQRYGIAVPDSVARVLADPACDSVKPDDPRLARSEIKLIARASDALAAGANVAQAAGIEVRMLGVHLEGDARAVAHAHAELVRHMERPAQPVALISGGELTVTVTGQGRGGPNREYILALLRELNGMAGVWALAGDTDGIDGSDDAAGAWIGPESLAKARKLGLDPERAARANDAGGFFAALGQAVATGPTRTNVNDFRALLVMPRD